MKKSNIFFLFFLFCIGNNFGQKAPETYKAIKAEYVENDIAISYLTINLRFAKDVDGKSISAEERSLYRLSSNVARAGAVLYAFTDDNTRILSYSGVAADRVFCGNNNPDWIFYSDNKICSFSFNFDEQGAQHELKLKKSIADIRHFSSLPLYQQYPVRKLLVRMEIPNDIDISFFEKNFEPFKVKIEKYKDTETNSTIVEYSADSIPAYINEENAPNSAFNYPNVLIIPNGFYVNNAFTAIFNNFENFYGWSKKMFDSRINDTSKLVSKVKELTTGLQTDKAKIEAIYFWVQQNIRYIAFEDGLAGFVPDAAENVFATRYGDCKGMSNLLKTMLVLAGFDARITWVGTNDLPYNMVYPSLASINHVICIVFYKNEKIILDATDKYANLGDIPFSIRSRKVMIENNSNFIIDSLPDYSTTQNVSCIAYTYSIANETLTGNANITFRGDNRERILHTTENIAAADHKTLFEKIFSKNLPNVFVSNIKPLLTSIHDSVYNIVSDIAVKGKVSVFEDDMYITPESFEDLSVYQTKDKRFADLDLRMNLNRKISICIKIPDGYSVKHMPLNFNNTNDLASFSIQYQTDGSTISCIKEYHTFSTTIPNYRFLEWNSNLKKIMKANTSQIVLSKKSIE